MILGRELQNRNAVPDGVKLKPVCCPSCGETDRDKFYVNRKGYKAASVCRECHKKKCMERWHATPELDRQASKAPKYGITPERFKEMHQSQQGKCAICGEEPTTLRGLHIDHCHTTSVVRGLLCHGCNVGLGAFKDNQTLLLKAIEYLKE